MTVFHARSDKGNLSLGSEYNASRFKQYLKDNDGMRLKIEPLTPESKKQRGYFEGCLIPLITYYQEGLDHRNSDDRRKVRDWVKMEFLPEHIYVAGRLKIGSGSTKGRLNDTLVISTLDWLNENYSPHPDAVSPEHYKKFRDEIYSHSNYETYIDYLIDLKKI